MTSAPIPAAAVILVRDSRRTASSAVASGPGSRAAAPAGADPAAPAAFLVVRAEDQTFLGGFACFPGGRVDPDDASVPVIGATGPAAALVVAAARELFEETGVLLARGRAVPPATALAAARIQLLRRIRPFALLLDELGVHLTADLLVPAGRWITPAYVPLRFDTQYFLATAPPGVEPTVIPGELQSGAWLTPAGARARCAAATLLLPPPVRYALEALEGPDDEVPARLQAAPAGHAAAEQARIFEVLPGIVLVSLVTPTLPPARFTNCYVLGTAAAVIVDPGSPDPAEQAVLDQALTLLAARGTHPSLIVLTHHHPDHVGGAAHLRARYGLPVAAHADTAARLRGVLPVDRILADDEVVALPGAPPRRVRLVATPGHAPGHLALLEEETGALCGGDLVATVGFIVIDPDDGGDLTAYLESLRRARALGARLLLPAHGLPTLQVAAHLERYVTHRLEREARVVAALRAQPQAVTTAALLPVVYADTPPLLWPVAERSLRAHLEKLARDGRATRTAAGWRAVTA